MIQKTSREVGIEPGTFEFIEVKYKCPGFDPHVGRFLGPYEGEENYSHLNLMGDVDKMVSSMYDRLPTIK